ncbi:MAG TPA: hypothetical protein PK670_14605, partial [Acidovorax defluvii]|nr:hypothetical protein [Acidovorax defluvii]HQT19132.1 hypothetical protein [Acidovorax defluvii]HQT51250.1 hypothetical protein [Acidovorax defluvii]
YSPATPPSVIRRGRFCFGIAKTLHTKLNACQVTRQTSHPVSLLCTLSAKTAQSSTAGASDHQAGQEFVHKMNVRFAKKGGAKFNSDGQICEKSNIHR